MYLKLTRLAAACALAVLLVPASAWAHFIWLVPQTSDNGTQVQVYFSEAAEPDSPKLLERLKGLKVLQLSTSGEPRELEMTSTAESLSALVPGAGLGETLVVAAHDLGVLTRGENSYRVQYYAKGGPAVSSQAWTEVKCGKHVPLDLVPTFADGKVTLQVTFNGKPVANSEVKVGGPGLSNFTANTDAEGIVWFKAEEAGVYSIRARHIDATPGELGGKTFPETRYYTTIGLTVGDEPTAAATLELPDLPVAITSFGGAVLDGYLYVYGGNTGDAHKYSKDGQAKELRRVPLTGGAWETVSEGPGLQGLALVAHGGKLYRIGGFAAMNEPDEEKNLVSQPTVAAFDPQTKNWTELPALPEPRSSHDAAVVGDTIYVAGGWQLNGDADQIWHSTAWQMDLSADKPEWKPLPAPGFHRRALALAAHNGKLYVIGGMDEDGGPTSKVNIYDPQSETWSAGPNLAADQGMKGFGSSAFAIGDRLYVSTVKGNLQRLSADGTQWEIVMDTPTARFFHRMLPLDAHRLVIVGGANMSVGKFEKVEVLDINAPAVDTATN